MSVAVVRILPVTDRVVTGNCPAAEQRMRSPYPSIDDIGINAAAGRRIVIISVERQVALVDAVKPEVCAGLRGICINLLVLLDLLDAKVLT